MRRLSRLALATSLAFAASSSAFAYTPETGIYWNPEEPGTGLLIEVQDNFVFLFGFLFEPDGSPTFVTAQGFLEDSALRFASTDDASDGSSLNTFQGGQCLGCDFTGQPQIFAGSEGPVTIEWDPQDETRATVTWGGRTTSIERFQFYLARPTDQEPVSITKMLGEWSTTIDFSQNPQNMGGRFDGDVLVIDQKDAVTAPAGFTFEGCRPADSLVGFCSDAAFDSDELAGTFDEETGRHLMLVNNGSPNASGTDSCLLYDVRVGTNDFAGGLDGDLDGSNDGGVTSYACGAANVMELEAYPVRGFRTASRSFVEDGTGPSKALGMVSPRQFPASAVRANATQLTVAEAGERDRRTAKVRELELQLRTR